MQDVTFYQPSAEALDLPSRGITGGAAKLDVRPMTMKEEKFFTNKTLAKTNKIQQAIFKSCVQKAYDAKDNEIENFKVEDLLVEDEYALLVFLRVISYGIDYDVNITCPECGHKEEASVNLESDLKVTYATSETPPNVTVVLPRCGATVEMVYPTSSLVAKGGTVMDNIPRLITKATQKDGTEIPKEHFDMWCMSLIGMDSAALRNSINTPFGLAKSINYVCPNPSCDTEGEAQEVDLPITGAFFRLSAS